MLKILLVPLSGCDLPDWVSPNLLFSRCGDLAEAIERVAREPWSLVVVFAPNAGDEILLEAEDACLRIEATAGLQTLPTLLAADSRAAGSHRLAELADFDGYIDVRWSMPLIARALRAAVERVRSGRAIVATQHQVLRAVRQELGALKDLSVRDELTGLFNLRYFREVLAREHQRCSRHGRPYSIACFDVDNLRELNNQYGHATGSRALARVGSAMASNTRKSDYAFRTGGDEFVALLVESGHRGARVYAERLSNSLQQLMLAEGEARLEISLSAGVAAFPVDGVSGEDVLNRADEALYRAKQLGRNRVIRWGEVA